MIITVLEALKLIILLLIIIYAILATCGAARRKDIAVIAELQDVKAMMNGTYPFEKGRIREKNLDFDTFMHRP